MIFFADFPGCMWVCFISPLWKVTGRKKWSKDQGPVSLEKPTACGSLFASDTSVQFLLQGLLRIMWLSECVCNVRERKRKCVCVFVHKCTLFVSGQGSVMIRSDAIHSTKVTFYLQQLQLPIYSTNTCNMASFELLLKLPSCFSVIVPVFKLKLYQS